jgi:hypothetical protein
MFPLRICRCHVDNVNHDIEPYVRKCRRLCPSVVMSAVNCPYEPLAYPAEARIYRRYHRMISSPASKLEVAKTYEKSLSLITLIFDSQVRSA